MLIRYHIIYYATALLCFVIAYIIFQLGVLLAFILNVILSLNR